MSLIKEYSLTTPLNEGEIKEIIGLSDSKTKAGRLFEQWAKDIKEMREERRENESSTDTRFMVESIRNLASKTFLTEAQLMHIVDKNEQLDFKDINESVLVDLVKRELDGFSGYDRINESKKYAPRLGERLKRGLRESKSRLDESDTVTLGSEEFEIPKGTKFISVDYDTVAWKSMPTGQDKSGRWVGPGKIGVIGPGWGDGWENYADSYKSGEYDDFEHVWTVKDFIKSGYGEYLNESNEENITKGDVNTIIFGQDDRIEIPVGYTHIAVDFDGTVNAYTNRPVLGEEGWEGEGPIRIGRVEWDDYKLQSGSNDINLLRNEKRAKMLGSVISVHDKINIGSQLERTNSFLQWKSDFQVSDSIVNESVMDMPSVQVPQMNRFLAVPAHML